jgi:negative regulator of genetic competence, sporulation and motility
MMEYAGAGNSLYSLLQDHHHLVIDKGALRQVLQPFRPGMWESLTS